MVEQWRCPVTGMAIRKTGKRGRPKEYACEDARQLALSLQQVSKRLDRLRGRMTKEAIRRLRADVQAEVTNHPALSLRRPDSEYPTGA